MGLLIRKMTSSVARILAVFMSLASPLSVAQESSPPDDDVAISFSRISADEVQTSVTQWLQSASEDAAELKPILEQWQDTDSISALTGEALLDRVVESFATVDSATRKMLEQSYGAGPVDAVIFDGVREAPFYRNNIQLFRARWLAQHRYYDDALPILDELNPDHVIDPAGLLFYRAMCQAELLRRTEALESLTLLLHNTLDVPERFVVIAEAMEKELSVRKDDGMSKVTQLMKDVNRRLDQGNSGEQTQGQEKAVLDAIDALMEELEQQNQKQQNDGGGNGSQQNDGGQQPASQSQIKGGPADGEADRKELTEKGKWGMLNQKDEAKARELIRQKFPPNFLDQIGRYTKKLAEQKK